MSALLYDVCPLVWCLPICKMSSTVWFLPTCMMSAKLYSACFFCGVCPPVKYLKYLLYYVMSVSLYDVFLPVRCLFICVMSAYMHEPPFLWLFQPVLCLSICIMSAQLCGVCPLLWHFSTCMMSAYLYDGSSTVRGVNTNKCECVNKITTIRARRMFIS